MMVRSSRPKTASLVEEEFFHAMLRETDVQCPDISLCDEYL